MSANIAEKGGWLLKADGTFTLASFAGRRVISLGIVTFLWIAFTGTAAILAWQEFRDWRPEMFFILLFPVIGIGLLAVWCRSFVQWLKFGRSVVRVSRPPVTGSIFEGEVVVPSLLRMTEAPEIILECTQVLTRANGNKSSAQRVLVWQETARPPLEEIGTERGNTIIPFRIAVPYDCRPTSAEQRLSWRLRVAADIPGVDFGQIFELSMPKTDESDPSITENQVMAEAGIDELLKNFDSNCGIRFARKGDVGLRMVVAPVIRRSPGNVIGLGCFTLFCTGGMFLMLKLGALVFFAAVFGLVDLLLVAIMLSWCTTRRKTQLTPDGLTVDTRGLFGHSSKHVSVDEIEGFKFVKTGSGQSGENMRAYYKVVADTCRAGTEESIQMAHMIGDKNQARAVVRLFEEQYLMLGGTPVSSEGSDTEIASDDL